MHAMSIWVMVAVVSAMTILTDGVAASGGNRVLALLQSAGDKDLYTTFLGGLEHHGFQVDVKSSKDTSIRLKDYDSWLYDHLVIFAPKADGFGGRLDNAALLEFVDSGHNMLIAVSSDVSETMRNLVAEMGVELDDKGTKLFDHFGLADPNDHTLLSSSDLAQAPTIVGQLQGPVMFRGIAQLVPPDAELVTVALAAPATAYSHDPRKAMLDPPNLIAGAAGALVTAVQARNNARVVVSGSLDMFSDALIGRSPQNSNAEFTSNVALWAFQNRGVLEAGNLRHHLIDSDSQPSQYRVNDDVEFLIDIHEYNSGHRTPYKSDDVQVEFVMLDPHVRATLQHDGAGVFSLKFKVPDVYGVFKYSVQYSRVGYSHINLEHQVPVRPFRHDEYERFLVCAYPYYASAASTMAAFFLVGFLFLYHK